MSYWKKLLIEWRKERRDGFTIPYLIGSQQFLPANHAVQDIGGLISEISENTDTVVFISYCDTIGDVILGIKDHSKRDLYGEFPPFRKLKQNKFFITPGVSYLGGSVETIISNLTLKYNDDIASGRCSLNKGKKGDYSPDEKEFIKRCFA